ncbi:hypothetical protein D9615_005960 [Tricholomella constricta]|uniref:Uncharacterized protein n=1 Tax=Tricholomella constricta TaxID=117010 RepID=A0A8H5H9W6_9AGAR|nr:hypothetical protein D9615_005960 [Tricholomella constricta]
MYSKVFAIAAVLLTLSVQGHAHATIAPVLGVAGTPKRSDVQRPRKATPCGRTNIAANIDTSTPVVAAADGSFSVTATNFNGGRDGSRQVTMTVDVTGTGGNFVAGTVSKNGVLAPTSTGSEQITASLPAGTKCTGGASGNLCLASFKTAGGFGNCVVVQQGAAAAAADSAAASGGAAAIPATGATGATTGNGRQTAKDRIKAALANAAGSRAARARRAELEAEDDHEDGDFDDFEDDHEEGDFEVVKRSLLSWIWA